MTTDPTPTETPRTDKNAVFASFYSPSPTVTEAVRSDFARLLERELTAAQAELARVKEEYKQQYRSSIMEETEHARTTIDRDRLRADNERLRAALEKIKALRWGYDGDCGAAAIVEAVLALAPAVTPEGAQ